MDFDVEIIPAPVALPAIIMASGPAAPEQFLEFFAANIRNPNTRRAYARQVMQFLARSCSSSPGATAAALPG
jgi:hypothetical protein